MDRAQHVAGPGLATADDCDEGEEVSRVRLRYPKHLMSCTIALAHTLTPSHSVRKMPASRYSQRLHRESWALRGTVAVSQAVLLFANICLDEVLFPCDDDDVYYYIC